MEKHSVSDVAKLLEVSMTTVYKKARKLKARLEGMTTKEKGVIFFSAEAVEVIRQEITTAPKESVLSSVPAPLVDPALVASRLEGLEKAVMLLVESNKVILEENRALRSEVLNLQKALEYKKPEPAATHLPKEKVNPSGLHDRRADPREGVTHPALKQELKNYPIGPARHDQETGFMRELREVQEWLSGLFSPFTELFQGK